MDIYISDTNNHIEYPLVESKIGDEFLFDVQNTTDIAAAGPNTTFRYATVRIIMFIDEYVRNNVSSLSCIATLLKPNVGTYTNCSTVHIAVTALTTTTTTTTTNQSTSESTSRHSNSALVVCSSVKLLCFFQLLYVIASYYSKYDS